MLTGTLWLALLLCAEVAAGCSRETEYRRFDSPDGRYHVSVYRRSAAAAMPGQSGDAPGTVRLHDKSGRVLQEAEVDMVQRVDQVEWDADLVHVKLVADWPLRE